MHSTTRERLLLQEFFPSAVDNAPEITALARWTRFSCAACGSIGSGVGFLSGNPWLAYILASLMVILATVAGLTHWCFASTIYSWLFQRASCQDT